jgi:large subunit ribosomal protein L18
VSVIRKNKLRKERRAFRTRQQSKSVRSLPRVSIFRSAQHIYAQIIDDAKQETLVSCSSLELNELAGDKKSRAHAVGLALADRAKAKGIKEAFFDRGSFLYHGRVESLANGLREGGLKI